MGPLVSHCADGKTEAQRGKGEPRPLVGFSAFFPKEAGLGLGAARDTGPFCCRSDTPCFSPCCSSC